MFLNRYLSFEKTIPLVILLTGFAYIFSSCSRKIGSNQFHNSSTISGRSITVSNIKAFPFDESGTVSMKVCIDKEGRVTRAEILPNTTISNISTLSKFIKAMHGFRYAEKLDALEDECGVYNYKIDMSAINR